MVNRLYQQLKLDEQEKTNKTLVVNMNKCARQALLILAMMMKINRQNSHIVKHTDSTEIPVCLNKNASRHSLLKPVNGYFANYIYSLLAYQLV